MTQVRNRARSGLPTVVVGLLEIFARSCTRKWRWHDTRLPVWAGSERTLQDDLGMTSRTAQG
jgi:hypothetical protein